jgi:branched-chain amino acid transport system ATP-binding protein
VLSEQFVHRALSFADSCVILSRGRIGWSGRAVDAGPEVIDHYLGDGEEMLASANGSVMGRLGLS